ncbi:MAG: Crp/Fnr family transcriptional regulator [Chitinophagaceae bacterium]|nr:Crp/Fnr family transcriptional regulator [Chitinophagaceae bacterium]
MKKLSLIEPQTMEKVISICQQYAPLDETSAQALQGIITLREYRKNEHVFEQDQFCGDIFVIVKGAFRLFHKTTQKEHTTWLGYDDHIISSLHSILFNTPAKETMHILEESVIGVIPYNDLLQLSREYAAIDKLHRTIMSVFIMEMQENLFATRFMEAADRYHYFTQKQPEALQRIPLTYLASFLGITKESLSRIRSGFRNRDNSFGLNNSYLRTAS